jgi:hypothetical protein
MKKLFFQCLQAFLVFNCRFFMLIIKVADWLFTITARIVTAILFLASFSVIIGLIESLTAFWQSLILKIIFCGGPLILICLMALFFWKPQKFFEILGRMSE